MDHVTARLSVDDWVDRVNRVVVHRTGDDVYARIDDCATYEREIVNDKIQRNTDAISEIRMLLVEFNDRLRRIEEREGWPDEGDLSALFGE